ncbi:MAG: outer membrane beta-barrel protein [Verrucomicrobiales bacterium]|nr:outer membrane beta-barrel protein [Verrucomicrobiales bacterium]
MILTDKIFGFALASLFVALAGSAAKAQEHSHYAFVFGGYSFNDDFDPQLAGGIGSFEFNMDSGWNIGAGVGIKHGCMRFEIEGLYEKTKIKSATINVPTPPPPPPPPPPVPMVDPDFDGDVMVGSDVVIKAAMFNILKEFPLGCVTGYIGGGLGIASFGVDSELGTINFFDSDTAMALQFIAGVDVPVTECISLFTQYRLLTIDEVDLESVGVGFTRDRSYSHSVNVGARYSF